MLHVKSILKVLEADRQIGALESVCHRVALNEVLHEYLVKLIASLVMPQINKPFHHSYQRSNYRVTSEVVQTRSQDVISFPPKTMCSLSLSLSLSVCLSLSFSLSLSLSLSLSSDVFLSFVRSPIVFVWRFNCRDAFLENDERFLVLCSNA